MEVAPPIEAPEQASPANAEEEVVASNPPLAVDESAQMMPLIDLEEEEPATVTTDDAPLA